MTDKSIDIQLDGDVVALLHARKLSILVSTYQAGRLLILSSNGQSLIKQEVKFDAPMGIATRGNQLAIAVKNTIVFYTNHPQLAQDYPDKSIRPDACFTPSGVVFTGQVATHDIAFYQQFVVGVNTRFSCLSYFDLNYSFAPVWKPNFISRFADDDACHLNGLAMAKGDPAYVTALGETSAGGGWREDRFSKGVLMDVKHNEVIARGLSMPHSPRMVDEDLYLLTAGDGALRQFNCGNGQAEVLTQFNGFVRGLDVVDELFFVGMSKTREHKILESPHMDTANLECGVAIWDKQKNAQAGKIVFDDQCREIYDVKVIQGCVMPIILSLADPLHEQSLKTPHGAYWGVAK